MKKFLSYIFILIMLAGLFSPMVKVNAQILTGSGLAPSAQTQVQAAADALRADEAKKAKEKADAEALQTAVPSCWNLLRFDMGKCLISISYFLLYTIPSSLLALSAIFFNATIAMALSSVMYTAGFVSEAWAIVRDISNIFFILILLYVAIQTILGLGHETKKVIVQVIIMALLINFSMFFSKVIIDTSNILALVFYNKINVATPIKIGDKVAVRVYNAFLSSSKTNVEEKDISGGIFASFDPTRLMTAEFFEKAQVKTSSGSFLGFAAYTAAGAYFGPVGALVGAGAYGVKAIFSSSTQIPDGLILTIIIVSGLIMGFAAYTFFVVGLTFIARIAELWILIIFSPFAFMSSSLPHLLGNIGYVGWEEWIKRIMKLSFMAPIFMFFVYLIFKIVQVPFLNGLIKPEQEIYQTMLLIILQALVVLILLHKAAKYAKDASGELGAAVIGGAKMLAGLAVGGAALGTAVVGRSLIGQTAAGLSRRSGAMAHGEYQFKLDKWNHGGRVGPAPVAPTTPAGVFDRLGAKINKSQWQSGDVAHARHEMDELKKKVGVEGLSDAQLSGVDKEQMKRNFIKDKRSEVESDITKGYDAKGKAVSITRNDTSEMRGGVLVPLYTDAAGNAITAVGKNDFANQRRQKLVGDTKAAPGARAAGDIDATGELSDQGKKKVEDKLNQEFNEILKKAAGRIGEGKYTELEHEANEKVGMGTKLMAKSTSGSYDPRNIPDIKADKRDGIGTKATVGIIAAVALGMRAGLKQGAGVNYGTPQRDVIKDIGDVVKESLKSAKIDVHVGRDSGSHGKGDSHGTSGGGHH